MPSVPSPDREVFVSRFNRVLAVLIWVATTALTVGLLLSVHDARLLYIVPCVLFAFLGWVMLWRPFFAIGHEGLTVVNVTRTIRIPWEALIHIDTKYALTFYTPGKKFPVWSTPAPGTSRTLRATRNEIAGRVGRPGIDTHVRRPGDLVSTESGAAAEVVRRRWAELQAADAIEAGRAEETPLTMHWHIVSLGGVIVLTACSVLALLLT